MSWTILEEGPSGQFNPSDIPIFTGTDDELQAYLSSLQEQYGKCFSAELAPSVS